MLYRTLGSTGEKVSTIGLGGWHLGLKQVDEQLSVRIVRTAIDRGVTFMDNSWDYNEGLSELRMGKALREALNLPTSVVITGVDSMPVLDQAIDAVRTFEPMGCGEVNALLAKTRTAAAHGQFEPFKTSSIFDSTAQNPAWLGEEPMRLQDLLQDTGSQNKPAEVRQQRVA
jgi:hypothetical protein